jgi:flagellar protein FlaG
MASGVMAEAILIIASVVIATAIAGVVMSQLGVFESTFTATTESQKDMILTKIKIVYATNTTDSNVNVWIKNIGVNPILGVNNTDVYFGEIDSVTRVPLNTQTQAEDTWMFDAPLPEPAWQLADTHSINITDSDIVRGVTYVVSITTPNGVSDEYIFSLP